MKGAQQGQAHVRSALEVRPLLHKIAKTIGELHGVELGVVNTTHGLFFSNGIGEIVRDGPVHILAASEEEIATGDFLKFFISRVFYAALSEAFAQQFVRNQLGGVN